MAAHSDAKHTFLFPPSSDDPDDDDEEQSMRRRHSRRYLDLATLGSEEGRARAQAAALAKFRTYYAMKGWNAQQTQQQLQCALEELARFLAGDEFVPMNLEHDLELYRRQWNEEQMPLILDQYKGFIEALSVVRRLSSPDPPHNVRFSQRRFALSWDPPVSRQEKELLVAVQVARQQLEKFRITSSSSSQASHPAMIALQVATQNLLKLRNSKEQQKTGTAENRGASNVDPSQTFFIVEIINMRTHKMLRLDVGYTYTLPVELSVAFDLHFEGAGQRPASTSTSNRRRRQTIATVPSSESSRDRSSTQGSSPMPSERHGGSREAEIESMSAAPPSPAGPYITDTSGRRNPLPPAPPAPVTLSLEPNTKYQVCVVTARKCTLNGHQMKWRNLYSKPAQPFYFQTPLFLDYAIDSVLPEVSRQQHATRAGGLSSDSNVLRHIDDSGSDDSDALPVFPGCQFRKPSRQLVASWRQLVQHVCTEVHAKDQERAYEFKITELSMLLWVPQLFSERFFTRFLHWIVSNNKTLLPSSKYLFTGAMTDEEHHIAAENKLKLRFVVVEICNAMLKDMCRSCLHKFVLTGKVPPPLRKYFGGDFDPTLKRWKCLRMSGADAPITTYMTHHFSRCLKKMWKIEKDTFKVTKQALQIAWQFFPPKFVSQGRSVLRLYKSFSAYNDHKQLYEQGLMDDSPDEPPPPPPPRRRRLNKVSRPPPATIHRRTLSGGQVIPLLQSPIALTSPNGKDNPTSGFDSDDQHPDPGTVADLMVPDSDQGNPDEDETEDGLSQEETLDIAESLIQPHYSDDASADVTSAGGSPPMLSEMSSMDNGGDPDGGTNSQNARPASDHRLQKRHPNLEAATKSWLLNFHVIFPKTKRALEDLCHNMHSASGPDRVRYNLKLMWRTLHKEAMAYNSMHGPEKAAAFSADAVMDVLKFCLLTARFVEKLAWSAWTSLMVFSSGEEAAIATHLLGLVRNIICMDYNK